MSLAFSRCKWIGLSVCLVLASSSCSSGSSSPSEDAPSREEPGAPGPREPEESLAGAGGETGESTPEGEGGAPVGGQPGSSSGEEEHGGDELEEEEDKPVPSNGGAASGSAGKSSAAGGRDSQPDAGGKDSGQGGTAGSSTEGGTETRGGAPSTEPSPEVLRGAELAASNLCTSCHQADYSGLGFYPNITPDLETGIGAWSDAEVIAALKAGTDANGETLCSLMPRLPTLSDADLGALVAFLRSLSPVSNVVAAECPGHGQ